MTLSEPTPISQTQHLCSIESIVDRFSTPKRLAVIGSLTFSHPSTEHICHLAATQLAQFSDLILLTGGVPGIPEALSRHLWRQRPSVSTGGSSVYHVQPQGFDAWDYGETITAGRTMTERRQILVALAPVYLLFEGGMGSEQEARQALKLGALLIPVAVTGKAAQTLYGQLDETAQVLPEQPRQAWQALAGGDLDRVAAAIATLVQFAMANKGHPLGTAALPTSPQS